MNNADIIIVGAGAAGLMCAITAGQRGRKVVVLEGSNKVGKKILMSGGGRCNFTNLYTEPDRFLSSNPHFCISALSRYTKSDFIALVEKYDVPFHKKKTGQLFCDRSSKDVVAMLLRECELAGVSVLTLCEDVHVSRDSGFAVRCSRGNFQSESLVIATGGLSIPKMGASDFGYRIARQFGIQSLATRAGLVPFTFTGSLQEMSERLSGVSCKASLLTGEQQFEEDILFTHRGLSGPAALQASSYWQPGANVVIDLFPSVDVGELLLVAKREQAKLLLRTVLNSYLPRALVLELQMLMWADVPEFPIGEISDDKIIDVATQLQHWTIRPAATAGYRTAEVTLGGIDTDELSSKTMESTKHRGLYFVGEVIDVTGHLGGFNFQWAWSSGWAAGQAA